MPSSAWPKRIGGWSSLRIASAPMLRRLFSNVIAEWRVYAAVLLLLGGTPRPAAADEPSGSDLYARHCAECHGADRRGGSGPALLPESLHRLKRGDAVAAIAAGRPATQMRGFGDELDQDEISALADMIYRPLPSAPEWPMADIEASRVVHNT